MSKPERRTAHLRWGRVSRAGSTYFVTLCVKNRAPIFADEFVAAKVCASFSTIHHGGDAEILAAITMPDHVHLLFTLGKRLRLGQVFGKFKSLARDKGLAEWRWQEDGFEHELRARDSIEDYGFYIFMNPYRAGILPLSER